MNCKANHGGVRGKLPKENDDEEPMDGTANLNDSNDELIATMPDDEVNDVIIISLQKAEDLIIL